MPRNPVTIRDLTPDPKNDLIIRIQKPSVKRRLAALMRSSCGCVWRVRQLIVGTWSLRYDSCLSRCLEWRMASAACHFCFRSGAAGAVAAHVYRMWALLFKEKKSMLNKLDVNFCNEHVILNGMPDLFCNAILSWLLWFQFLRLTCWSVSCITHSAVRPPADSETVRFMLHSNLESSFSTSVRSGYKAGKLHERLHVQIFFPGRKFRVKTFFFFLNQMHH